MDRKNLWVSIDRFGIMRPTKNIPMRPLEPKKHRVDVEVESNEDVKLDFTGWRSISNWIHWDLNPWMWTGGKKEGLNYQFEDNFISEFNGTKNLGDLKLQGLINLTDAKENDGGFCAVPGFHKHLKEWSDLTKDTACAKMSLSNFDLVNLPPDDSIQNYLEKNSSQSWKSNYLEI